MSHLTLFLRSKIIAGCLLVNLSLCSFAQSYTSADFHAVPPLLGAGTTEPFVMISLSVELTQQAEAYTGADQTYVQPDGSDGLYCAGRTRYSNRVITVCYSSEQIYLGYFNPDLCYDYYLGNTSSSHTQQKVTGPDLVGAIDPPHFFPVKKATNGSCGGLFYGNYMNWATMTALDEFRSAMTGGARLVDTKGASARTLLTRTKRLSITKWRISEKHISKNGIVVAGDKGVGTYRTDPRDVTPFDMDSAFVNIYSDAVTNRVKFLPRGEDTSGWSTSDWTSRARYKGLDEFYVIVKVCDDSLGVDALESNCTKYTDGVNTWYKPEGLIQSNATHMRFALASYAGTDLRNQINGGVLRSFAKYVGPVKKSGELIVTNPNQEFNEYGQFVFDPDSLTSTSTYIKNSGVINYINTFAIHAGRYKSFDPVAELYYESLRYLKGFTSSTPEYYTGLGTGNLDRDHDGFPILRDWTGQDPVVEACQANYMIYVGDQFGHSDGDLPGTSRGSPPSNPDTEINVTSLLQWIGDKEDHNGLETKRGQFTTITWGIAALSYYARTQDIRTDMPEKITAKTFIVDTQEYKPNDSAPKYHNNPLWLAAKWGGFEDQNDDSDPNNGSAPGWGTGGPGNSEWDADGDGEPDSYILASQPANLVSGLKAAFSEIRELFSAGSSAGVVSNTASGQSVIFQALFKPSLIDAGGTEFRWGGMVHSLFVDEFDNLREDSDGDGKISNADSVITFDINSVTKEVTADRFSTADGGETVIPYTGRGSARVSFEELDALWNARDVLSDLENSSGQMRTQRAYGVAVSAGAPSRYIFTSIDEDGDGLVVPSGGQDFTMDFIDTNFPDFGASASESTENNFRYLGLNSTNGTISEELVNFIRGEEVSGFRSREVDYDGDGVKEVWRLGDIVSSSPLVVAEPRTEHRFDLIYDDDTFTKFYDKYRDRRQVVYTGANDGMLHAFNAGFYDRLAQQVKTQLNGETNHPLGAELWGYVPYNLLPHLQWLTEVYYPHVFYVDGEPQSFEVNIFPDDADHPNGWGTILVVGMRLGGGEFTIDPDSDIDSDTGDDKTLRSSYLILDITNPETAPTLLAEVSHEKMGYTLGRPTVVKSRVENSTTGGYSSPEQNDWFLVLGSGPYGGNSTNKKAALEQVVSDQKSKVFVFDLRNKAFVQYSGNDYIELPETRTGFTSDLLAVDWDNDFVDDVVYFGTVTGSVNDPGGDLWRLELGLPSNLMGSLSSSKFSRVVENSGSSIDLPVAGRPYNFKYRGDHWLAFGTGRFFVDADSASTKRNSYFGIKEPLDSNGEFTWDSVDRGSSGKLLDVTYDIPEYIESTADDPWDGFIVDRRTNAKTTSYPERRALLNSSAYDGWYFDFIDPTSSTLAAQNSARVSGGTVGSGPVIVFSEYWPSTETCDALGESYINQLYLGTGLSAPFFDSNQRRSINSEEAVDRWIATGSITGRVYEPPPPHPDVIIQSSTGQIVSPFPIESIPTRSGFTSWREIRVNW